MAAREGDTALWLHNKLGSTDDLWSGSSISSNLSREKLLSIRECFYSLQPYVKVKLMLAFLHLPKRNVEEWRSELEEILHQATEDTDQWVAVVGEILRTYPQTGTLNTDVDTQHRFFHDVLTDLKKLVKRSGDVGMMPLECLYLNRVALQSAVSSLPQPMKHFALKRKPKSAALRADLMQKSAETANNLRKNPGGGMSIPIKPRSFAKKMDDKTPMKGIPSKTPYSGGFLRSNSLTRGGFGGSPALGQRTPTGRKEGGIKLLDITEMPIGTKEARKRKRQQEQEAAEKEKKEKEALANQTPDYAAGLVAASTPSHPFQTVQVTPAGPSYAPNTAARLTGVSIVTTGTIQANTTSVSREGLQTGTVSVAPTVVTVSRPPNNTGIPHVVIPAGQTIVTVTPQQVQQQQANQPQVVQQPPQPTQIQVQVQGPAPQVTQGQQAQPQPLAKKPGLTLTREQMYKAQEMFITSNKVTRPEKALILGFMAGSRENPCEDQGDIVNIRLSEDQESIKQPDGTYNPMVVDTFFQMNYQTGEWRRIKKLREILEDDTEQE